MFYEVLLKVSYRTFIRIMAHVHPEIFVKEVWNRMCIFVDKRRCLWLCLFLALASVFSFLFPKIFECAWILYMVSGWILCCNIYTISNKLILLG